MNEEKIESIPNHYSLLKTKSEEIGFTMHSEMLIGSFLKTLVTSKPAGKFLELGTGMGLSLAWMIDGMDQNAQITSIDNDQQLVSIVSEHFKDDLRATLICEDGSQWLMNYQGSKFDLIFADAWPGKYSEINKTLDLVKSGGFYVIDDMIAQPNWPEGHQENVEHLLSYLEHRTDFHMSKMNWSSGIVMMCKK